MQETQKQFEMLTPRRINKRYFFSSSHFLSPFLTSASHWPSHLKVRRHVGLKKIFPGIHSKVREQRKKSQRGLSQGSGLCAVQGQISLNFQIRVHSKVVQTIQEHKENENIQINSMNYHDLISHTEVFAQKANRHKMTTLLLKQKIKIQD